MATPASDFVVVAFREEGRWAVARLPDRLADDLAGLVAALRQQPAEGGTIGLIDIAHEFFVAVRLVGPEVRLLLSDAGAALDWDLAERVLGALEIPLPPEEDAEELWPAGDLSIFADLGLDEMTLGAILADADAFADEMLATIARHLGFAEAYQRVVEATSR